MKNFYFNMKKRFIMERCKATLIKDPKTRCSRQIAKNCDDYCLQHYRIHGKRKVPKVEKSENFIQFPQSRFAV